ncbi:MAG: Ig-like domain-containing protein [Gemmatimonadota bacterium]|nr:Ig-like domain-containing protein [Gemmatimonadota bacterium]
MVNRRVQAGLWSATVFLMACGAGGTQRATIESAPPAPRPASTTTTPADSSARPPAPARTPTEVTGNPTPSAQEYPAAVRVGARVADIRTEPGTIEVQVGDSISLNQDVDLVAVDANGNPVPGVRILSNIDSRHAVLERGYLKGVSEGDAVLQMAIRAPPSSGIGDPEIKTFSAAVRVVGPPVIAVEIVLPDASVLTGTVIPLRVRAETDGGVRENVEVTWSSNRRRLATVDSNGFLSALLPGAVTITAEVEGIETSIDLEVVENPIVSVVVEATSSVARTGDVVRFTASGLDEAGGGVDNAPLSFSVSGFTERADLGASIYEDGAFVADRPGLYRVTVSAGTAAGQHLIEITPRNVEHEVVVLGQGLVSDRPTSDLWAFTGLDGRDYVYTGTHDGGQRMLAWDVTSPANPVLTDFVEVDARVVNDVKVNEAATVAVITREGASDRQNGIVLLDITDPAHPVIAGEFTEGLTGGVHNVFIAGTVLYAIHDGTLDVHILDISDPTDVEEVGRWGIDAPGKYLHDIWVLDGMAYVSYWHDGVYILDVGDGRWGGTPTEPVEVSHYAYPEGNTHVAFPYTNEAGHSYLFVGDEIFGCEECISRNGHPGDGSRGFIHVIDMEDPEALKEVARYEVPEAGAHNLWVEDDKMYVAYYQAGLRVVDVSGELRGDLFKQGREMAWFPTGTPDGHVANSPMAWGPQPFKGHVFVSDLNSGLWVVRIEPKHKAPVS